MNDLISRQAALDAIECVDWYHHNDSGEMVHGANSADHQAWYKADDIYKAIESVPSAQGKPFNLPGIYIADGYDTIEGEDGNVGFGVYVPDENQIYVAGDAEGEIRARALLHEICHWVQAMCGRPFDEDEANEFSDIIYDALPSAQPEPLSDAYTKAVWTWLLEYQIKAAELKDRYTPYEVLSWVANDWRKEHERLKRIECLKGRWKDDFKRFVLL